MTSRAGPGKRARNNRIDAMVGVMEEAKRDLTAREIASRMRSYNSIEVSRITASEVSAYIRFYLRDKVMMVRIEGKRCVPRYRLK